MFMATGGKSVRGYENESCESDDLSSNYLTITTLKIFFVKQKEFVSKTTLRLLFPSLSFSKLESHAD